MATIWLWLIIALVGLALAMGVVVTLMVWDWRSWLRKKYGNDYRKGLAHIKHGGEWGYWESQLVFEGDDADTYNRKQPDSDAEVSDIVPKGIGYAYSEGRRVYRVQPGGTIATSDDGEPPLTDYPSELISTHTLDRTVINYASSVNDLPQFPWKIVIIGALILIAIFGLLFMTGTIKLPGGAAPAQTANVTAPAQTAPTPTIQPGQSGPVGGGQ